MIEITLFIYQKQTTVSVTAAEQISIIKRNNQKLSILLVGPKALLTYEMMSTFLLSV